jgi:hypothetical protein
MMALNWTAWWIAVSSKGGYVFGKEEWEAAAWRKRRVMGIKLEKEWGQTLKKELVPRGAT